MKYFLWRTMFKTQQLLVSYICIYSAFWCVLFWLKYVKKKYFPTVNVVGKGWHVLASSQVIVDRFLSFWSKQRSPRECEVSCSVESGTISLMLTSSPSVLCMDLFSVCDFITSWLIIWKIPVCWLTQIFQMFIFESHFLISPPISLESIPFEKLSN